MSFHFSLGRSLDTCNDLNVKKATFDTSNAFLYNFYPRQVRNPNNKQEYYNHLTKFSEELFGCAFWIFGLELNCLQHTRLGKNVY